jgi:rhodanese-related sulfurtransferase
MTMERSVTPDVLKSQLAEVHLIDVRRKADRDASTDVLPGAIWHDPEQLAQWAGELPTGKPIVLYCVRGGSVSNSVVDALQAKGLNARFIDGGIEGWKAAGGAVGPKQS